MPSPRGLSLVAALLGTAALAVCLVAVLAPAAASAQRSQTPRPPELPPISMTCPMHPEVVEADPGTCPICRMKLEPVRLDLAWACPIHPMVTADTPGTCAICQRDLGQVTVAITWVCPAQPAVEHIERGTCADGSRMVLKRTVRPHGDHNPRYGGQFFMAPDNWHHLEGTYPADRVFRLYLYDDYSMPLPADRLRAVQGRVVTQESYEPATRQTTELSSFPLRVSSDGAYLEARVDTMALPAQLTAKVRFKPESPEYRFDFTFHAITSAPAPAPAARTRASSAPASAASSPRNTNSPAAATSTPAAAAPAPVAAAAPARSPTADSTALEPEPRFLLIEPDASLIALPIPDTVEEILEQLSTRNQQIGDLIAAGNFEAVFVPAFQAKDLAIALESRLNGLRPERRRIAEPAIQRLVRTAWLLDAFGDAGNRQQLAEAFGVFAVTAGEVIAAFSEAP